MSETSYPGAEMRAQINWESDTQQTKDLSRKLILPFTAGADDIHSFTSTLAFNIKREIRNI